MAQRSPRPHPPVTPLPGVGLRSPVERGRLGAYAALGATLGAVPLPWVPGTLVRRVRGAVVHDIAVRHGLSLTQEARDVLCEPAGLDGPRSVVGRTVRFLGVRLVARALTRVGPLGAVWPIRNALRTYVLGHLFDRYLELGRTERAVRIDAAEARRIRAAVDGALARALTADPRRVAEPTAFDDQRDATTAFVDGVLGLAAGVPARLFGRLDAAFDDLLAHGDG